MSNQFTLCGYKSSLTTLSLWLVSKISSKGLLIFADVRSVGYSELFSLSREDVLTAMKDYPDAQEILQTLGRKRLMEVRCVNKKYAKSQTDKEGGVGPRNRQKQLSYVTMQNDNYGESAASKNVDDKLKNDVKELINVLKNSRNSRLRNEVIEMQHIQNLFPKNCRSEINQMPCAFSDEKDEKLEEKIQKSDNTPSPIGAGLPLLQRLRLLKEKQTALIIVLNTLKGPVVEAQMVGHACR
uniref:Cyclic nucleotide-binding domain-containing protein n=1 Tax=Glossina austeni TaxID=7395 RepID=A0A1A9VP59_GLOAU